MRLTLKGFQSHADTILATSGDFICVVGPNNVGKSSIIRAAQWLFYDALRGSRFLRKGTPTASVEIEFPDGPKVTRIKGSGRNAYVCNGKEFEAIGKGAPVEVSQALGIASVMVDKDLDLELNVVRQKDAPFLMDVPGTVKAKVLNALTGLHVLDIAIRDTVSRLRSLKAQEKSLEESRTAFTKQLEAFSDLPGKEQAVKEARALTEKMLASVARARTARQDLDAMQRALDNWVAVTAKPIPDLSPLDGLCSRLEAAVERHRIMRTDQEAVSSARWLLDELQSKRTPDMDALEALWKRQEDLLVKREALASAIKLGSTYISEELALDSLDMLLDRAMEDMRALTGSRCPECGQTLTAECLEAA